MHGQQNVKFCNAVVLTKSLDRPQVC